MELPKLAKLVQESAGPALDKKELLDRAQFERAQDPQWHSTMLNGGYTVYTVADKPVAIFSRKHGQGYILKAEWTKSAMDLVDLFKQKLEG